MKFNIINIQTGELFMEVEFYDGGSLWGKDGRDIQEFEGGIFVSPDGKYRAELVEESDREPSDGMTDAEADADVLASAGMGTDEDYGYYGGNDE